MKGFPKSLVHLGFRLGAPIIRLGKRLSGKPIIGRMINPVFNPRHNQLTALPIQTIAVNEDASMDSATTPLPLHVVDKLLEQVSHIMIMDACICRTQLKTGPSNIGCMILGKSALDIHPSLGHIATLEEARQHVRKAAQAGLVANVAHVWIDPVGFGVTSFSKMIFICFCGPHACIYTDDLKTRCSNLDEGYKRLPGIRIEVDPAKCTGCGLCADTCFVSAITITDKQARIGEVCKGCGRCLARCPQEALRLIMAGEDEVLRQLLERVCSVADISK